MITVADVKRCYAKATALIREAQRLSRCREHTGARSGTRTSRRTENASATL
jgi:hypothetical protein